MGEKNDEWKGFFSSPRYSLPNWSHTQPSRCVFLSDESGSLQAWSWDVDSGDRKQLSNGPMGVDMTCITPDGSRIWWFEELDESEVGSWYSCPFDDGAVARELPDLPPFAPLGLALSPSGDVFVGYESLGTVTIERRSTDGVKGTLFESQSSAIIEDLSPDGNILLISHDESGEYWALRAIWVDGNSIEIGSAEVQYNALGFSPDLARSQVLLKRVSGTDATLVIWDLTTGVLLPLDVELGSVSQVGWYQNARAILVVEDDPVRSLAFMVTLDDRGEHPRTQLDIPDGIIARIAVRPDGDLWATYSCATQATAVWSRNHGILIAAPQTASLSAVFEDHWIENDGQQVHTLVATPKGAGPFPSVILLHGGPHTHDDFSFSPRVAAWVSEGFAVIRPNYRGSDGYGKDWQNPVDYIAGTTELSDIEAVRNWSVKTGLALEGSIVIAGGSWGGFLALLAAGRLPALWNMAIAITPIADYVAAFEDEGPLLKRVDEAIFGGTPADVLSAYLTASPITYVPLVTAPVLLIAGVGDPRCPIRQVRNYAEAMRDRKATCEIYTYPGGHGPRTARERIKQMAVELKFARKHLPTKAATTT